MHKWEIALNKFLEQYIKVASIDEIKNEHTLDYHDLSELDLRKYKDLFDYAPTQSTNYSINQGNVKQESVL